MTNATQVRTNNKLAYYNKQRAELSFTPWVIDRIDECRGCALSSDTGQRQVVLGRV